MYRIFEPYKIFQMGSLDVLRKHQESMFYQQLTLPIVADLRFKGGILGFLGPGFCLAEYRACILEAFPAFESLEFLGIDSKSVLSLVLKVS